MIKLEQVSKLYANASTPAVRAVDIDVAEGSLLVLLGESGSGKTTTLKMINRLIEPTQGRISVAGNDIREFDPVDLRRRIGYAFQGIGLFPHMTVAENVAIVPRMLRWPQPEIARRVDELLELVGLPTEEYKQRFPSELSGGQQQRVGVARALAAKSKILLMDEPFGALDPITRDGLQSQLRDLKETLGLTIMLVTHDITEALLLADRVAIMRDGEILRHGTPAEVMSNPGHDYVAHLMDMPKRQAQRIGHLTGLVHD